MGDPVGVAGTAVGVVSLGLQVYGGLKQYLDDFNSRDERVAKTLAYLEQLKEALDIIDAATHSLRTQQQTPADTVLSCLRSCLTEIQALQTKMQEFGPSQQINLKGKMKEIKKKLEYPFQISVIEEIGKNLERITNLLLLAIHGLELHSYLTISANVDALGNAIRSQTDIILSRIESDSDTIRKISNSNSTQLTEISSSVQPLMPMLQSLESVTGERWGKFENQVHTNHSVTTTRLDVLESGVTEVLSILRRTNDQKPSIGQEDTGRYLVGTLVSKPSLLRDVHKSYDFRQESAESTSNPHMDVSEGSSMALALAVPTAYTPCRCRQWRRVDERQTRWRAFCFFSKEKTVRTHHPSCSRYSSHIIEHQRTFGITYTGLRQLLSAAVSVSLSLDYGAGGTSISPTFRYYHVVDRFQSLPFRMIKMLSMALHHLRSETHHDIWVKNFTTDCISRINEVYYKRVASPLDVTDDGLTLIDYFDESMRTFNRYRASRLSAIATLLEFGVTVSQKRWLSKLGWWYAWPIRGYASDSLSLVLHKTPDLQYALSATHIDFIVYGDIIRQSGEISDAVELDLDSLCTVLLHQDLNGLSQILTNKPKHSVSSGQYGFTKSLMELAVRWPVGLKRILETEPRFFNPNDMETLFLFATRHSMIQCKKMNGTCHDCSCSEPTEILLEHGFPLTQGYIKRFFTIPPRASKKAIYMVLRHLQVWRKRLQDTLDLYLPVGSQNRSTVHEPSLLDYEAACAVKKLQAIGRDPYTMFGLAPGDYRLGSSLDGPRSIFHMIDNDDCAQTAFDLGFRDVDVLSEKGTPLSQTIRGGRGSLGYRLWLIAHGADYTRELPWIVEDRTQRLDNTVEPPRYLIIHWVFRFLANDVYTMITWKRPVDSGIPRLPESSWLSQIIEPHYSDGCSCACLSSPQGCSPIALFFNQKILLDSYGDLAYFNIAETIIPFFRAIEPKLIEPVIRCITFHRLGIRHTCCASVRPLSDQLPSDYGSDFDELREEDKNRVHQLNQLVANFMDQYNASNVSLADFIYGPFREQMERIELEEASQDLTMEEKSKLLSIGVLPKEEAVDAVDVADEFDNEGRSKDRWTPEYWARQFEIIANGGRSKEETYPR